MAKSQRKTIETLIAEECWDAARRAIETTLKRQPRNHWLLTQLGVTLYEQGHYRAALTPLLDSLHIMPECPLTLWNVAGTLDALEKPDVALPIYLRLLESNTTADDDPCWEGDDWAASLRTDCLFRAGLSLQHLGRLKSAIQFLRRYVGLNLDGMTGMYDIQEAADLIREMSPAGKPQRRKVLHDTIQATLKGIDYSKTRLHKDITVPELLAS